MTIPFRVAVVNSHPIQYFAPLYAYLNGDPVLQVTALYCSDFSIRGAIDPGFKAIVAWDVDLLSGYKAVYLGERAKHRTPNGFWSLICPQVWNEIRKGGYDAVWLHGYNYAAYIIALLAAKTQGLPVLMRSETHLGLSRNKFRSKVRDFILSFVYRFVDGFLAIGTANHAYYRSLGVPEEKIFNVPYTIDNARFTAEANLPFDQRLEVRRKYGLSLTRPVILYASKLMRRKHPDDVIRAVATLKSRGIEATAFMVGTGEMDQELRRLVTALDVTDSVVFGGFVNQSELPQIYAASDIFVLPSEHEPWGLILNEVMCAGLPVVVSDEVGCVADLVKDGVNGYHMRAGEVGTLVAALSKLLLDDARRKIMGEASLAIIRDWNYDRCRQGIITAMRYCSHS